MSTRPRIESGDVIVIRDNFDGSVRRLALVISATARIYLEGDTRLRVRCMSMRNGDAHWRRRVDTIRRADVIQRVEPTVLKYRDGNHDLCSLLEDLGL